nr:T9SS type A sorting domain-containing protein [uncultured Carboxylicivirga sp.]
MKKIYLKQLKTWTFTAAMLLTTSGLMAQTSMTWNGAVSTDATVPDNWTPATTMAGNDLVIGNSGTYTYAPTISGTETLEVHYFDLQAGATTVDNGDGTTTDVPAGVITINMATNATFRITANITSGGDFPRGDVYVLGGNFHYQPNKNYYMDSNSSFFHFDCDTVTFRNLFALGDRDGTKGGRMEVVGSTLVLSGDMIRVPTGLGREHLYIADDAEIRLNGDKTAYVNDLIAAGSMGTSADKDIVVKYDPLELKTYITTRLKTAFVIEPTDRQLLSVDEVGSTVSAVQNDGFTSMTGGVEWVYGTVDGTFDTSFSPAQTGATIDPVFSAPGTYYLALKGIDGDAAVHYSNSVEFVITSNLVTVAPEVTQNLRLGQMGGMVTVTEEGTSTAREWKYSTTGGGPYVSFATPVTGPEFVAEFTEVGTYFVVCESTIDGTTYTSKEIQYNVTEWNAAQLNITFGGINGTSAEDIFNWDPAAYVANNGITIPEDMSVVISKGNNDTIKNINIKTGSLLTFNGQSATDTLWYRNTNEWSGPGSFLISNGVFVFPSSYFRLYNNTTTFTVEGNAQALMWASGGQVLLDGSSAPVDGSNIIIRDNAIMYFSQPPGRIAAAQGYGELRLSDNAEYHFAGDVRGSIATWLTGTVETDGTISFYPKFITPEGFEPQMIYDEVQDLTIVSVRALSAFGIEQTKTQIVGIDRLTNTLSLVNAGGYDSYEWKWSPGPSGPFQSFDPAVTGATAQVSFPAGGTYYVVCYATLNGVEERSNNSVPVKVVDIAVSPADTQYIPIDADGTELSVTLPDGALGIQWRYSTVSGGPYEEFNPQELSSTYLPWGDEFTGNHYIVYEATVTDDDGQQVTVYSNEVSIMVGATAIGDNKAAKVSLYPNPSDGNFFIDVEEGEGSTIEVINAAGATVSSQVVSGAGKVPVSVSTKGLYLVKVTTGNSVTVKRVIVK